ERVSTFRAGGTAELRLGNPAIVDGHYAEALKLMFFFNGLVYQVHSWQRQVSEQYLAQRGVGVIDGLRFFVNSWRQKLLLKYPGVEVWPVVIVDPMQRFLEKGRDELEA